MELIGFSSRVLKDSTFLYCKMISYHSRLYKHWQDGCSCTMRLKRFEFVQYYDNLEHEHSSYNLISNHEHLKKYWRDGCSCTMRLNRLVLC